MSSFYKFLSCIFVAVICVSTHANADGLSDLKAALVRLQGQTPVKALVEAKTWNRQGEGKDQEETQGLASVSIEESSRGLQVLYSKDMLLKLESEERQREKDKKAKTPTLSALSEVNSSALRPMISAASSLSRSLEKANFKSEKADSFNGKPARLLNFEMSIDKLNERERKYMKKFDGQIDVWIAADGTPLASRLTQTVSGRAYVVISFEMKNEEEWLYGTVGDRLVALKKESKNSGVGMGEKGEGKVVKTLQIQAL
ncbi:hypothetical protein [Undibacterium baiyunense]|uniref:Uncharacterized protein n=1 Tax=Undibacterium baiyunense TaxID=2828731 RepID=A0A941DF51_9BURK|nr:hypothetical protein [Undibacterium baiyunense]MBR7747733.1 hypothetical protein [Undibacterium baiyunense]